jgi:alginate O-acetyltransferase complex protein AlgI
MLLGGLWHGAGLNFVLWGGLHGLLLAFGRRLESDSNRPVTWSDAPRIFLVFQAVCLAWVPFRATSGSEAMAFYHGLISTNYLHDWPVLPTVIVALCAALHVTERYVRTRLPAIHARVETAVWGPAVEGGLFGAVLAASILASGGGAEFIYFQF